MISENPYTLSVKEKQNDTLPQVLVLGELSLVHCLGTAGIPVVTASERKRTPESFSRYSTRHLVFSSYESGAFVDELCEFGEQWGRKSVLVTYDDRVILNISKNRERLGKHFLFLLPDHRVVEQLLDKLQFCELARQYDLPVPTSIRVSSQEELQRKLDVLEPPFLIKPAYRHYWFHEDFTAEVGKYQKAYRCSTAGELFDLYDRIRKINPHVVVQEYIVGKDSNMYDLNFLVDREGSVRGHVIARKLRVYPPTAGWGSYVRTVHSRELVDLCGQIIEKLDLRGLINIQFKRDSRTGVYKLIEIHTRTSIFDYLGARAGANLPALYSRYLNGDDALDEPAYREGVKYINIGRDLRLFARYGRRYDVPLWRWALSYFSTSVFDGFRLNDLHPLIRGLFH